MNPQEAVTVVEPMPIDRPLSVDQVHAQLEFVRSLMAREMREGEDYGRIPGCGPKPTLLQPGAQKLLMTFNLTEQVKREVMRDFPGLHREYEFTIAVSSPNGKTWDGVGTCSTLESKYRFRQGERLCPKCGKPTIIKGKAEYGGGWICFAKKGGCGEKWAEGSVNAVKEIESQTVGKVENDNPPDMWNTVRKMAFKRALVAATINATNTSELWTQDLDENGAVETPVKPTETEPSEADWQAAKPAKTPQEPPDHAGTPPPPENKERDNLAGLIGQSGAMTARQERLWKALEMLEAKDGQPNRALVTDFLRACGVIRNDQQPENWPMSWLPQTMGQARSLLPALARFRDNEPAVMPYAEVKEEVKHESVMDDFAKYWEQYVFEFGGKVFKGRKLGKLTEQEQRWWFENFECKDSFETKDPQTGEFVVKPKSATAKAKDQALRMALDAMGKDKGWKREEQP